MPARKKLLLFFAALIGAEGVYRLGARLQEFRRAAEPPGAFEIYAVGGSTALGEPYDPTLSFPGLIAKMFGGRMGPKAISITNLGHIGISLYPEYMLLDQALRARRPGGSGVVLIYAGHNELFGKNPQHTPLPQLLRLRVLERSWVLRDAFFWAEARSWLPRVRSMECFEHYLRKTIELGIGKGLTPMLSTAVSNISGIDPMLREGDAGLSLGPLKDLLEAGEKLEKRGESRGAIRYYEDQIARHPALSAYLWFRIGRCHQRLHDGAQASRFFWRAIDQAPEDNFRRASTAQNELIRRLAREYGIPLVDSVRVFERASPGGVIGNELFADGQHPNVNGYLLIADGFARAIAARFGRAVSRPIVGPQEAFRAMGLDRRGQVAAFLDSGRWLFSVCEQHAWPRVRLALAERRFSAAAALDPDSFSAWLGLGLVEAAGKSDLLLDEENAAWLTKFDFWYGKEFDVKMSDFPKIIGRLRDLGVADNVLSRIMRAYWRARLSG